MQSPSSTPPSCSGQPPAAGKLRVSIELTNTCNFSCPFCPQAYKNGEQPGGSAYNRRQGMMSDEVFQRTFEECNRIADTVELGFFGEQTLHKRYVAFMRHMKQRNFQLELNTNISFVTDEILDAWVEAKVDLVRLSLDAVTPEVFNRARPGQVRDLQGAVVPEAKRLDALHEKVHRWLQRPDHRPTRLVFVKSSWNEGEHDPFLDYWLPHLGPEDYVLMKQVLSYGGKTADSQVQPVKNCNVWDMRFLMVDWQGNLSPCNLDTNMDLKLGNVMDGAITEAYEGAIAKRLRSLTGCGGTITPCTTCTDGNNWSQNELHKNPRFAAEQVTAPLPSPKPFHPASTPFQS